MGGEPMVRVLVADDHDLILAGVEMTLSADPGLEVVGKARTGTELVSRYTLFQPDVVLCDDRMPGPSGVEAAEEILQADPLARIMVMSQDVDPERVGTSLKAGIRGWIAKDATAELPAMIHRVAAGERMVCDPHTLQLVAQAALFAADRDLLTPREQEVLQLMAAGRVQKEIARELGMGLSTVKGHRRAIREKLGAATSEQAVHLATRAGLV